MVKKVIHLEVKATNQHSSKHFFYGSMQALFNLVPQEFKEFCPSYGTLRNYALSEDKPYENKHVIIRKGELLTSGAQKNKDDKKVD